ncbi:hypothetical protein EDB92DRAFT_373679 [Lactarius akahatsu]|uniref:Uncharacterized protein n=1 Tax=Lactarius akahatsu TaxID=416441 RepID=A0AAD4LMA7_9AGAM|nr:hypothetical protein EDB92DRAFT_373679 [Lactarius akahatsu]
MSGQQAEKSVLSLWRRWLIGALVTGTVVDIIDNAHHTIEYPMSTQTGQDARGRRVARVRVEERTGQGRKNRKGKNSIRDGTRGATAQKSVSESVNRRRKGVNQVGPRL